jgi:rhodanese-related sulfurtransferase
VQVILLGSIAIGAGALHQRFASETQKEMIADTLKSKSTVAEPAPENAQPSPNGEKPVENSNGNGSDTAHESADNQSHVDEQATDTGTNEATAPDPSTYSLDNLPEMLSVDQSRWLFEQSALATGDSGAPEVYFIDAREHKDYITKRIWGALHASPESFFNGKLPEELEYWPRETTILVVYCQGGNCDASHLVSTRLRLDKQFKKVHILADGLPGWTDAELWTESGQPGQ